jgi:hypothetical protein
MVMTRRQFQVYARDFHFLVCILDSHVREGDLAIHDGQTELIRESKLRALIPAFTWGLGLAQLSIQFFLQLVVKLNAEDFPTLLLDLRGGLLIEAIERGVVVSLLGLYETGVDRLVLWHQTLPSQETLSLFGECQDVLRFFLEGTRATSLQEALPHEISEITVHSAAVPGVTEVREVFDRYHAKTAYLGEGADLRWPEGIRSVAVVILGPFKVRTKGQIAMVSRGSAPDLRLGGATV